MAHFRTMLTSDNFSAADLWSEKAEKYVEIDVEIVSVRKGEVVGEKGRKKGMPFITMKSGKTGQVIPKPLGCNATNGDSIAALAGSPDVKRWPGVWITLYVTKTQMGKGMRDAIRIRPSSPRARSSAPAPSTGAEPEPQTVQEMPPADFDPDDVQPEDRHG